MTKSHAIPQNMIEVDILYGAFLVSKFNGAFGNRPILVCIQKASSCGSGE